MAQFIEPNEPRTATSVGRISRAIGSVVGAAVRLYFRPLPAFYKYLRGQTGRPISPPPSEGKSGTRKALVGKTAAQTEKPTGESETRLSIEGLVTENRRKKRLHDTSVRRQSSAKLPDEVVEEIEALLSRYYPSYSIRQLRRLINALLDREAIRQDEQSSVADKGAESLADKRKL